LTFRIHQNMSGMSRPILRPAAKQCLQLMQRSRSAPLQKHTQLLGQISVRNGGKASIKVKPSTFEWHRFKNDIHFYMMCGAIPTFSLISFCNIFIGPSELADIPDGYEPKAWEYEAHPISRWFAKYVYQEKEKTHEISLDVLHREREKRYWNLLKKKVQQLQSDRQDYKGWYFQPSVNKDRLEYERAANLEKAKVFYGGGGNY